MKSQLTETNRELNTSDDGDFQLIFGKHQLSMALTRNDEKKREMVQEHGELLLIKLHFGTSEVD